MSVSPGPMHPYGGLGMGGPLGFSPVLLPFLKCFKCFPCGTQRCCPPFSEVPGRMSNGYQSFPDSAGNNGSERTAHFHVMWARQSLKDVWAFPSCSEDCPICRSLREQYNLSVNLLRCWLLGW